MISSRLFLWSKTLNDFDNSILDNLLLIMSNRHTMATKYKADLKAAEEILQELLDFKEHVETRIAMQKRKIAALRELSDMSDDADAPLGLVTGITDAVRSFMRA